MPDINKFATFKGAPDFFSKKTKKISRPYGKEGDRWVITKDGKLKAKSELEKADPGHMAEKLSKILNDNALDISGKEALNSYIFKKYGMKNGEQINTEQEMD